MSEVKLNYLRMTLEDSSVELSFDHQGCVRFSTNNTDEGVAITYEEFVAVAKMLSAFEH